MSETKQVVLPLAWELLREGKTVRVQVGGQSMLPTLRASDTLLLAPCTAPLRRGEVALFRLGDHFIVHRCLGTHRGLYRMCGDNNFSLEEVPPAAVAGRVLEAIRPDGKKVALGGAARARALLRSECRLLTAWLRSHLGMRKLRLLYFLLLAFLMWAPLNGLAAPLPNYVLGLRADHLVHASVFLPCAAMLASYMRRGRWWAWPLACLVGVLTESVQYLLPWRGYDINDMVANFIGVTLGWLLALWLRPRR